MKRPGVVLLSAACLSALGASPQPVLRGALAPSPGAPVVLRAPGAGLANDSTANRARLAAIITAFQAAWQRVWRASETTRANDPSGEAFIRTRAPIIHCHPGTEADNQRIATFWRSGEGVVQVDFRYAQLRSSHSMFAVCPTWVLVEGVSTAQDERFGRDGALLEEHRQSVHALRGEVLQALDEASRRWPGDGWITGQRVRFRFDQQDAPGALDAAASCRAASWWCSALRGYAFARRNELPGAERAFAEMRESMPAAERCKWADVRELLPAGDRKAYASLKCGDRDAANARLWWLADPLYRTAGNERLVEQEARRVEIALHRALPQDERYHWGDKYGGDALAALVLRYGWPSYTAWGGEYIDDDHSDYLQVRRSPPAAPYTTFEYAMDRVHTLPSWAAVMKPFAAPESSWLLSWDDVIGRPFTVWWPDEHFRTARRLVQLPEGQSALFRRDSAVLVAAAVQFSHPLVRAATAQAAPVPIPAPFLNASGTEARTFDVLLLSSPAPNRVDSIAHRTVRAAGTVTMRGLMAPAPAVIALEAIGTGSTTIDARTRFGVAPPLPLRGMRTGEIAVSDPVLLNMQNDSVDIATPDESLLDHMLGTVRLGSQDRRVGVYWETYGISATDTVTISVRVATDQALSGMRKLGMALNIAQNPNRAVVQSWTEPDAQRATHTVSGSVPVQHRSIVLNLGLLQTDTYVLEIIVERKDGVVATGRRRITVER